MRLNGVAHVCTIDHFFWNEAMNDLVEDAGVLHLVDNQSDHCPIYCVLNTAGFETVSQKQKISPPKPSWKKATQQQKDTFKSNLEEKLLSISLPSEAKDCTDVKCKDVKHCEAVDTFMANILHSVQNAAFEDLPVVNNNELKRKNVVPGWSAEVKPFRDTAYFWSQIWKSAGRPLNNELHRIMKRTRNIYHFQARKCKQGEEYIERSKLLDACVNGSEDIFSEIKKLRAVCL